MNIAFLSLAGLIAVLALVPLIRSLLGADGGSEAERSVRRARAALEDAAAAQVISAEEYQAKLAALPVIEVGRANAKAGVLALAVAVLNLRGFTRDDFAEFHPSGTLGRRLLTRVKDIMHAGDSLPLVELNQDMTKVLTLMTSSHVFRGVAGVIDEKRNLMGVITDGDIRRRLEKKQLSMNEKASELMSKNPKTIDASELAEKALFVMEQFQIQTLFVVDKASSRPQEPVGLIHLQDLLRARLR